MNEPSSMWREELWHPLSVHFPIGLLLVAGLIGLAYLLLRKKNFAGSLKFSFSLLLWIGLILFWVAFYTGQIAYNVEVRRLCDPTVVKEHLYWSYVSGYIFSGAVVLDFSRFLLRRFRNIIFSFVILLTVAGAVVLGYVGHLGAKLVYQQAAAVYQPSENCTEFE